MEESTGEKKRFPPPPLFAPERSWGSSNAPLSPRSAQQNERARLDLFNSLLSRKPSIDMNALVRHSKKGIPEEVRADVWKVLMGYLPTSQAEWEAFREARQVQYMDMLKSVCTLSEEGNITTDTDTHRIDVDINRTMPSMHFFGNEGEVKTEGGVPITFSSSQESLRRMLHSLARINKGFGYVQGMNELVGHLLFAFSDGKIENLNSLVETDVFFCFQMLLSVLGDNFCRSLDFDRESGVSNTLQTFEKMLKFCDVELYHHMIETSVRPEFYAFRWMTLLFTQEFFVPDVLRLWDFLFAMRDDMDKGVYFLGIAMMINAREELLKMNNIGFILPLLQQYPSTDVRDLVNLAQELMDEYKIDLVGELKMRDIDSIGDDEDTNVVMDGVKDLVGKMKRWRQKRFGKP